MKCKVTPLTVGQVFANFLLQNTMDISLEDIDLGDLEMILLHYDETLHLIPLHYFQTLHLIPFLLFRKSHFLIFPSSKNVIPSISSSVINPSEIGDKAVDNI